MGFIEWLFFSALVIYTINNAIKTPTPDAADLEDFQVPTAEEGRPIPVLLGTREISGSNCVWYGNFRTKKIKKDGGWLSSDVTVGYKYFMSLHLILGHSGIDRLHRIRVDERTVWQMYGTSGKTTRGVPYRQMAEQTLLVASGSKLSDGMMFLPQDASWMLSNFSEGDVFRVSNSRFNGDYTIRLMTQEQDLLYDDYALRIDVTPALGVSYTGAAGATSAQSGGIVIYVGGEAEAATNSGAGVGKYYIDEPKIFGGNNSQGGIEGDFYFEDGNSAQAKNPHLVELFGEDSVPNYRGVAGIILEDMYIGNSAYLKPWSFLVSAASKDSRGNPIWYSEKCAIGWDMNPAHQIYLCLTNKDWGLGYNESEINQINFRAVADTLYEEELGLSFLINKSSPMEDFISQVLNHIGATLILDKDTYQITINLIRDDFVLDDLVIYDESSINEVLSLERTQLADLYNTVAIRYWDRESGDVSTYKIQDLAAVQVQGATVEKVIEYAGVTNSDLAAKMASRDLKNFSYPLITAEIEVNRLGVVVNIGDPIRVQLYDYDIADVVFRVAEVTEGSLTEGKIKLKIVQDIFKSSEAIYISPRSYTPATDEPTVVTHQFVDELPYVFAKYKLASTIFLNLTDTQGIIYGGASEKDNGYLAGYRVIAEEVVEYTTAYDSKFESPLSEFIVTNLLTGGIGYTDKVASTNRPAANYTTAYDEKYYGVILVGDEFIEIVSYNDNGSVNLKRGLYDTFPAPHLAGDVMWDIGGSVEPAIVENVYATDDVATAWVVSATTQDELDTEDAVAHSVTMGNRIAQPYPPACVMIEGAFYLAETPTVTSFDITWQGRDKISQGQNTVDWFLNSGTLESGMTFNLRLYDDINGDLLEEYTGLTATSQTVDPIASKVRLELESQVNGITSRVFKHVFTRTGQLGGYGYDYGNDYGGS